jgi:histidinol phosphatase-like enzyme (inositol monophosphatase family)
VTAGRRTGTALRCDDAVVTAIERSLLDDVVELVREAGELTLRWFRAQTLEIERKHDGTPVTAADKAAERFLREQIHARWPDDSVLGEEEEDHHGTSGRTWIIDPIDGTKAFTHGVPLYSNLLSVRDEVGDAISVVNLPALGETLYAGRGLGCWDNGERARVSDRTELDGAYLCSCGFDYWPEESLLAVKRAGMVLRTWGDGYGYVLAATGRIEAMVDPEVALWDVAPMPLIFSEAGGRFSSLDGRDGAEHGTGIATNGILHDELLALLVS